jgi:hypothetical protein
MERAEGLFINGIIALTLSLVIWTGTGSFIGWLALAVPGAIMIFAGWIAVLRE